MHSSKELSEAKEVYWYDKGLAPIGLGLLGTLGAALETLRIIEMGERWSWVPGEGLVQSSASAPDGVQRLAEGLGAGALPALTELDLGEMYMGDAGASAFEAAHGPRRPAAAQAPPPVRLRHR